MPSIGVKHANPVMTVNPYKQKFSDNKKGIKIIKELLYIANGDFTLEPEMVNIDIRIK